MIAAIKFLESSTRTDSVYCGIKIKASFFALNNYISCVHREGTLFIREASMTITEESVRENFSVPPKQSERG